MKQLLLIVYFLTSLITSDQVTSQSNEKKKVELAALEFVLSEESLKLYKEMSDSGKIIWANRFWRAMDPTPTTDKNEYYLEFRERFDYAFENFHNITAPYYLDDRAKYYIKYGQPDDHVESVGIGKFYKDNITWAYYNFNLFIDFVDFLTYGYREVNDLSEAVSGAPINEKVRVAKELYVERTDISQKYVKFRNMRNDIDFYGEIQEINQEKRLALEQAPHTIYDFEHNVEPLTVRLASCVFDELGSENKARIELYYSLPLRELNYKSNESNLQVTHLNKNVIIYDLNYQPIVKREEQIPLYARIGDDIRNRSYVNQHNEKLPPGNYHLALLFENSESGRKTILKSQLTIKDFSNKILSISDVQFAHRIQINPDGKNLKPNDIQVVPYISSVILKSRPIMIYFEIYNLNLDENGNSRFKVEYEIKQVSDKGNLITDVATKIANFVRKEEQPSSTGTSFESSGSSSFEQIYSSLDFSSSDKGKKEFVINIKDLISGEETKQICYFMLNQ